LDHMAGRLVLENRPAALIIVAVPEASGPRLLGHRLALEAERTGLGGDVVEIDHRLELKIGRIVEMPEEARFLHVFIGHGAVESRQEELEMAPEQGLDD